MTFPHFNRRTHLYLGLFLLPWFFLYGLSSVPFSHPSWGQAYYNDGVPQFTTRVERPYVLPVSPDGDLRQIGALLMRETDSHGTFGVSRPNPGRIQVYAFSFRHVTQVIYDIEKQELRAQDRRFRWDQWLTGFHARGGFQNPDGLNDGFAVTIDIVCLGFLVWIASGLYMWWHLPGQRGWGWLAIGAGSGSFLVFLLML